MNPHQAVAILAEAPCLSPDEQKAATVLFNFARRQMDRRRRMAKAVDVKMAAKDRRIEELEKRLARLREIAECNDPLAVRAESAAFERVDALLAVDEQRIKGRLIALGWASPEQKVALVEALRWYENRVRRCRLISLEGDSARNDLDRDGGAHARAALARTESAEGEK